MCINSESCSVSCFYPKTIPRCHRSATNQAWTLDDHCQRNSTCTLHRGLLQQQQRLGGGVTVSEQHSAHSLQRGGVRLEPPQPPICAHGHPINRRYFPSVLLYLQQQPVSVTSTYITDITGVVGEEEGGVAALTASLLFNF